MLNFDVISLKVNLLSSDIVTPNLILSAMCDWNIFSSHIFFRLYFYLLPLQSHLSSLLPFPVLFFLGHFSIFIGHLLREPKHVGSFDMKFQSHELQYYQKYHGLGQSSPYHMTVLWFCHSWKFHYRISSQWILHYSSNVFSYASVVSTY